jgi:hypothetical protein
MFDLQTLVEITGAQSVSGYTTASLLISVGFYAVTVVALWPVFTKAGVAGWSALIPIVNTYVLVKIAGQHGALTFLYFVPVVNIFVGIVVAFGCGRSFGKGRAFSFFFLWLLAPIGYLAIGYGRSTFVGDVGRRTMQPA